MGNITHQCQYERQFHPTFEVACGGGSGPGCFSDTGLDLDDEDAMEGDLRNSQAMINHSLLKAAQEGSMSGARRALGRGAHVETRRPFIMTPESNAGGGVQQQPNRGVGLTPLMHAAHGGYRGVCDLLLGAGANVHAQDEDGMQPIHFAALAGSKECVKMLLENGADADAKDDEGRTAMAHVPEEYSASAVDRQKWEEIFNTKAISDELSQDEAIATEGNSAQNPLNRR